MSLCVATAILPMPLDASLDASASTSQTGALLLQAKLPNGIVLPQATYEQLRQAVGLAARDHRGDVPAILTAALARKVKEDSRLVEVKRSCAWVSGLLRAAMGAAPEKASELMEIAGSLCPDCADALQSAVELYNDKNVLDDKNVVDDKNGPAGARPAAADPSRLAAANNPSDPNDLNVDDPEIRNLGGFTGGFDPGFPGAPGFVGSVPGGNIALPRPTGNPVTPVMNE